MNNKNRSENKKKTKELLRSSAVLCLVFLIAVITFFTVRNNPLAVKETAVSEEEVIDSYVYGTMDRGTSLRSVMVPDVSYVKVTTVAEPANGGSVTPSTSIVKGTSITLNAHPNEGYLFTGWKKGDEIVSTSSSYVTPAIDSDVVYTAVFKLNAVPVIPKVGFKDEYGLIEKGEGGSVYGGGTIIGDGIVSLEADSLPGVYPYEFAGWYIKKADGTFVPSGTENPLTVNPVTVGLTDSSGANIKIQANEEVYAVYQKQDNVVIVTATMIPSIGSLTMTTGGNDIYEGMSTESSVVSIREYQSAFNYNQRDYHLYHWYETSSAPKHSESGEHDEYYDPMLLYVNRNETGRASQARRKSESDYLLNDILLTNDKMIVGNTDLFLKYSGFDSSFNYTCAVSTVAIPEFAGTTAGDMSSTSAFTTNIKATPYPGYEFDHWEWYDDNSLNVNKADQSTLTVSVNGYRNYKAFFKPATYKVETASISPSEGGNVKAGIGEYKYNDDVRVEIVENEGYIFKSCSYTTLDAITHTFDTPVFYIDDISEDIFLNIVFEKTQYTVAAKAEPLGLTSGKYNYVTIQSGDTSLESTSDDPTVEIKLNSQASVTLEAFPNIADGYKFVKWVGTDGSTSYDNPFTPASVTKDVTYIAEFEKEKYRINVVADPESYGNVYIGKDADNLSALGTYEVACDGSAYIKAEAAEGYRFLYWTNSQGTHLTESELTLEKIKNDETYVAHFAGENKITIEASPQGYGQVQLDDNGFVSISTTYNVAGGSDITLSAKPTDNTSYKFVKWVDTKNNSYSEPTVKITGVTGDETYTAIFVNNKYIIRTIADAVDGGTADVYLQGATQTTPQTSLAVNGGDDIVLVAKPKAGYQFLYWVSSEGTIYDNASLVDGSYVLPISDIYNDETFTAHFHGKHEVTIGASPQGYGQVELNNNGYVMNPTTYYVVDGSTVHLSAKPSDNSSYKFFKWVDKENKIVSSDPETDVKISGDENYTAIFVNDKYIIKAIADPVIGGDVNVVEDGVTAASDPQTSVAVNGGANVTLTAAEKTGYVFRYWTSSNGTKYYDKELKIKDVRNDETFIAHFTGEIEITIEASPQGYGQVQFNDSGYVLNSTTYYVRSGEKFSLQAKPLDNSTYKFVKWINSSGVEVTDTSSIEVTKNETFTAIFVNDKYVIRTIADPVIGGSVNVVEDGVTPASDPQTSVAVNGGADVTLKATPETGYKFRYWTSSNGTKYYDQELKVKDVANDETFTAHFTGEIEITIEASPQGYGQVQFNDSGYVMSSTTYYVSSGEEFTLQAKPLDDSSYKFDKWVDSEGKVYQGAELKNIKVDKSTTFTALFVNDKYTIRAAADPANGGVVNVVEEGVPPVTVPQSSVDVNTGATVILTAKANEGYTFRYWTSSNGTKYYDQTLKIEKVENDETFTAHFTGEIEITIEASPQGYGQVQFNDSGYVLNSSTYYVSAGEKFSLEAKPTDEFTYEFEKWIDHKGHTYTTAELKDITVSEPTTFTAMFVNKRFEVNTIADPQNGGIANVYIVGDEDKGQQSHVYVNIGEEIVLKAEPYEGYELLYWTSSSGTRYYDKEVKIDDVDNNETYTAHFYKKSINITVKETPEGAGLFKFNSNPYESSEKTYTVPGGSNITLTAQASDPSKYEFVGWEDSYGNFYNSNPLQFVEVTKDETFTAIFNPKEQEIGIVLKANPANGGSLSKHFNDDGSITISTTANAGFIFRNWEHGNETIAEAVHTIPKADIVDGDVYTAIFDEDPDYKPTSEIPYEDFLEISRTYLDPRYKVTRNTMVYQAWKQIENDSARFTYRTGIPEHYSIYDTAVGRASRSYKSVNDRSALLINNELVTTDSETVQIRTATLSETEAESMACEFTLNKFGNYYQYEILSIKQVTADSKFCRESHTFLLKDTGAKFQDNVYILYGSIGGPKKASGIQGFDWVTCVADEAGTLRFTIPSFLNNDTFIVVRVWPE